MKAYPLFITTILILIAFLVLPGRYSSDERPAKETAKKVEAQQEITPDNGEELAEVPQERIPEIEQAEEAVEPAPSLPVEDSAERALREAAEKIVEAQREVFLEDSRDESRSLLTEAEEILTAALAENPGHRELLERRAEVCLSLGEPGKALKDLEALIDITGGWPEIMMMRCMILERQDMPEATYLLCYDAVCERYAEQENLLPEDYAGWALAEMLAGHPEKAKELREKVEELPEVTGSTPWKLVMEEFWDFTMEPDGSFDRKSIVDKIVPSSNTKEKPLWDTFF